MCGIAGYVGRPSATELSGMSARIAHRGPDADAMWFSADETVGLAHRRLSILDLSDRGAQPMLAAEGKVVIIYNGELYNFRSLRERLKAVGFAFQSDSDTEVLLAMYLWRGEKMLDDLNGIFAFAIWDDRSKMLFVARDNVGVKPFYYTRTKHGFYFSSEVKSFLEVPGVDWTIDPTALQAYMTFLWSPGEKTFVKSVLKLEPGKAMLVDGGGSIKRVWRYYDLPYQQPASKVSDADAIDIVRGGLRSAVERQMISDVPVGAFLSGGLDSSAVCAFAKDYVLDGALKCFTIKFGKSGAAEEGIDDDLPYARRVAKHLSVDLTEVVVGPESLNLLPAMVYMMDEPQADVSPINAYLIAKAARDAGIKVLLSGLGGDDIYAGYRRHYALLRERLWSWIPSSGRKLIARSASNLPVRIPAFRRLRKGLAFADLPEDDRLIGYFFWSMPETISGLLAPDIRAAIRGNHVDQPMREALARLPSATPAINRMLYLDAKFFVPDHNLNFFDKTTMASGVECRVPMLDIELISAAADLPASVKQRGSEGKWILKKAMEPFLPREIIYRPKTGFGMPLRSWMRGDANDMVEDLLSEKTIAARGFFEPKTAAAMRRANDAGTIDASYTLLSMMNIELWSRIFLDRTLNPAMPR